MKASRNSKAETRREKSGGDDWDYVGLDSFDECFDEEGFPSDESIDQAAWENRRRQSVRRSIERIKEQMQLRNALKDIDDYLN